MAAEGVSAEACALMSALMDASERTRLGSGVRCTLAPLEVGVGVGLGLGLGLGVRVGVGVGVGVRVEEGVRCTVSPLDVPQS